jgi:hypothetical protein
MRLSTRTIASRGANNAPPRTHYSSICCRSAKIGPENEVGQGPVDSVKTENYQTNLDSDNHKALFNLDAEQQVNEWAAAVRFTIKCQTNLDCDNHNCNQRT